MTPNSEMGGICLVKEHNMGLVDRETYPTGEFISTCRVLIDIINVVSYVVIVFA